MFLLLLLKNKYFILLETLSIYYIIMAKFVEMDERIKFKDQIEEKIDGSIILINKFNVAPR